MHEEPEVKEDDTLFQWELHMPLEPEGYSYKFYVFLPFITDRPTPIDDSLTKVRGYHVRG